MFKTHFTIIYNSDPNIAAANEVTTAGLTPVSHPDALPGPALAGGAAAA